MTSHITCKAYEIERPARPGSIPSLLELRSITANKAAKKMIKLPMNCNRMANHLIRNNTLGVLYSSLHVDVCEEQTCLHIYLGSKQLDYCQLDVHSLL